MKKKEHSLIQLAAYFALILMLVKVLWPDFVFTVHMIFIDVSGVIHYLSGAIHYLAGT